jgi:hypothetical protein
LIPARTVLPVLGLALVGWGDLVTGPQLAFFPFYLCVLVAAALTNGVAPAMLFGVLAAGVFLLVDLLTSPHPTQSVYPYWRAVAQLMSFSLVTYTIPRLLEERRRLARSEQTLIAKQAELEALSGKLIAALEQVRIAQQHAIEELRRGHAAEIKDLREALRGTTGFLRNLHTSS